MANQFLVIYSSQEQLKSHLLLSIAGTIIIANDLGKKMTDIIHTEPKED